MKIQLWIKYQPNNFVTKSWIRARISRIKTMHYVTLPYRLPIILLICSTNNLFQVCQLNLLPKYILSDVLLWRFKMDGIDTFIKTYVTKSLEILKWRTPSPSEFSVQL